MTEQTYYAAPDAICSRVTGPATARIYRAAKVEDTVLGEYVSIADYCRVGRSVFGDRCFLQRNCMVYDSRLGRYSYAGKNATIWHADIGSFCSLSWNISIGGANHDYTRLTTHSFLYDREDFDLMPPEEPGYDRFAQPCVIGHDVWIAANACVMRGVTVGTGAVIAAGAVVTRDVPPYAIAAGVPARVVKYRFSPEIIARLLASAWWELPAADIRENFSIFNAQPDEAGLARLEALCAGRRRERT